MKVVLGAILLLLVVFTAIGCNQMFADGCRKSGGQPIMHMYEYNGCVEANK